MAERTRDPDPFFADLGPTVGYCSKCGDVREAFYTCRDGGRTIPKDEPEINEETQGD